MENNILGRMNIFFIALSMDPEGCSDYTKKIKVTEKYGIVWSYVVKKYRRITLLVGMYVFCVNEHRENIEEYIMLPLVNPRDSIGVGRCRYS